MFICSDDLVTAFDDSKERDKQISSTSINSVGHGFFSFLAVCHFEIIIKNRVNFYGITVQAKPFKK